ncbi:MAG TPA: glycoside hydrolase family 65, partial [Phycisphaerae bacterium]|nr:glycoside hydrolase family 65 [Phycisphaerae bacterium]
TGAGAGYDARHAVLETYKDIVFGTADYIATIVDYDPARKQYVLGPGVGTADEKHTDYAHNLNPTLELGYCKWALGIAREWRTRLGLPPDETWDKVYNNLAPLTVRNGIYPALELPAETSSSGMTTFLLGALPGKDIDKEAMRTTLHAASRGATGTQASVTWGTSMWAMCAVREGEPDLALQLLAGKYDAGKNPFMPSGYTVRRPEQTPMYFPANGGWLAAAALMTAGWDGNTTPTPGFPKSWKVRFENILPLP